MWVGLCEAHGLVRLRPRAARRNWQDSQRIGSKLRHSPFQCFQLRTQILATPTTRLIASFFASRGQPNPVANPQSEVQCFAAQRTLGALHALSQQWRITQYSLRPPKGTSPTIPISKISALLNGHLKGVCFGYTSVCAGTSILPVRLNCPPGDNASHLRAMGSS